VTIVAFLQNQWFKPRSVPTIQRMYREHGATPEGRAKVNARLLFFKSVTGQRLKAAFSDMCDRIIWEESSCHVGCESSSKFPADPVHINAVLDHFKPDVVLAFGTVAKEALRDIARVAVIAAPHPAARHPSARRELQDAEVSLRALLDVVATGKQIAREGKS
jgi:hypothetical protein